MILFYITQIFWIPIKNLSKVHTFYFLLSYLKIAFFIKKTINKILNLEANGTLFYFWMPKSENLEYNEKKKLKKLCYNCVINLCILIEILAQLAILLKFSLISYVTWPSSIQVA